MIHKKPLFVRILLIFLICAADIIGATLLIYRWKENGTLIPSTQASADLPGILLQNLLILIVPILIFAIFLLALKKDFVGEMYLRIKGKLQWIGIFVLILCLTGVLIYHLMTREDRITAVFLLFYYVFIIAFWEEFICRGACTYLIKNEKTVIRFLIPNLLFALSHIFNYSGWGALTGEYVVRFLRTDMIVIFCVGCINQALKEKTGTIWIPVLLHAAWDFALAYK
ncbi:MAG: CPBP family intramembrane metalloprotease [Lachnospiraceae bacterium]|nr:CPBP family intramembrane metalloprotease [Lachnospiraceae bacterium]